MAGKGQEALLKQSLGSFTGAGKKPYICDGLLCFLFSIPCIPAGIFNLALQLHEVCFQLLLGVDEAGVLGPEEWELPRPV